LENVEQLRGVDDSQWQQLKLPMGLVNAIKKRLNEPAVIAPSVSKQPVEAPP
jgi:hypothetical protein